eukprot:GFYU01002889.1.p1 GENE.GFYU01002889.1~~GFYU01002889.1.p1  ORF type:complete len:783 (-),score=246.37 GFYU01002889.1:209-2557(-)
MAEARNLADLHLPSVRSVHLTVTDEGGLHLSINIPPVKAIQRSFARSVYRKWNSMAHTFFPLGPAISAVIVGSFTARVLTAEPDSWWRNGNLANLAWDLSEHLPFWDYMGRKRRITTLTILCGIVVALFLAILNRQWMKLLLRYKGWMYTAPGKKPNMITVAWGAMLKTFLKVVRKPLLYSFQGSLPHLPVPKLSGTCDKYILSLEPILSSKELEETKAKALQFQKNEGPKLQRYLWLKWLLTPNYVSDWWLTYVYLKGRSSLLINSNPYTLGSSFWTPTSNQAARAGSVVYWLMRFKRLIDREELSPTFVRDLVPMCMQQYEMMFSTTRIPGLECDTLKHYDSAESRHIVVYSKGRYYHMSLFRADGTLMTPWEYEQQFEAILADTARTPAPDTAEARIPALTAWERTRWAEAREEFFSSGINKTSLDIIESSVLMLTLDDSSPEDWTSQAKGVFHGNGSNLWLDKNTLVVFKNGKVGMCGEHSPLDAPAVSHMWEWSLNVQEFKSDNFDASGKNKNPEGLTAATTKPKRLVWDIKQDVAKCITAANDMATSMIANVDHFVLYHDAFGKGAIKKCRISPDAFIQIGLQLAYFRDAGHSCLTYEAAMARLYVNGRTETIRSCSNEAQAFVKAMMNPKSTKDQKKAALVAAASKHSDLSRDAMVGDGIDRHLFALYVVSVGLGVDSPFLKEALSRHWVLSTSQVLCNQTGMWQPDKNAEDCKRVSSGGFGPVADDGYGVSYLVVESCLWFHVSSKKDSKATDTQRFVKIIKSSLADMMEVFAA